MLIVDPLTSAMYRLPNSFLAPMGRGAAKADTPLQLRVVALDSLSAEVQAQLVRVDTPVR